MRNRWPKASHNDEQKIHPNGNCRPRARLKTVRILLSSVGVASIALVVANGVACNDVEVHPLDGEEEAGAADAGTDAIPTPPVELGRHSVTLTSTRKIVPSAGLPANAPVMNSNNNLDVLRFAGRVWLAWRTAPNHFASADTKMVIASSEDETTWRLEKVFAIGTDLREPRFLAVGSSLFFYLSVLGKDRGKFEPQGVRWSTRDVHDAFTDLAPVMRTASTDGGAAQPMTGYIAWRTKIVKGTPYMTAYLGGEHIYQFDGLPLDIELLTTQDGVTWTGVNPDKPVVSTGGGSEMDFSFADDGTLFAIIRNEAGDETGWGSKICRASAANLSAWTCKTDKKKYDSPLVFAYDGEIYLVGRRHLSPTGDYDNGTRDQKPSGTTLALQYDYLKYPKRCALWRVVQNEDRVAFVMDLPSRGDTCFASAIAGATNDEIVLYNYSSDIDGPDLLWAEGKEGPTFIYRHTLRFLRR